MVRWLRMPVFLMPAINCTRQSVILTPPETAEKHVSFQGAELGADYFSPSVTQIAFLQQKCGQGLPQSVRLRLTAGGGASQLRTWLARPRHQVRLRCASRDACPPLASTARTGDARYRPVEHVPVGGRLSPSRTPPPPHRKWWVSGSTTSTATSSATATQRWAPPAPLPARRHCLFGHPSRAPSARPLPYR